MGCKRGLAKAVRPGRRATTCRRRLLLWPRLLRSAGGSDLDKGEALRYLAELPWNPDAILHDAALEWWAIDSATISMALGTGDARAEVTFTLGGWAFVMIARRRFLSLAATAATTPLIAKAGQGSDAYGLAAAKSRGPLPETPGFTSLVRFAALAPNGHNTQPWTFADRGAGVTIEPDLSRRTSAVDPDDHHLFVSLGCAAENLLVAAAARGRPGAIAFDPVGEGRIAIHLGHAPPRSDILFRAIPTASPPVRSMTASRCLRAICGPWRERRPSRAYRSGF